ncbi:MAG: response regulator, partial [Bacteroidetes bacterium]|nr:response regulator [Bacteroidota bacterium]
IKENKIYFSAYQVDDNNFKIVISDNYASTSEYLANTIRKLFIDKLDPKEFGVSKLNAQITQSLLDMLQVKFVSSVDETGKHESGFLFPIKFTPQLEEPIDKIEEGIVGDIQEKIVEETEEQQMPVVAEEEVVQQEIPLPEDHGIVIEEETEFSEQKEIIEPEKSEQIQEEFEVSESFPEKVVEPQQSEQIQEELKTPESFSSPTEEPQQEAEFEVKDELIFNEVVKQEYQHLDDKLGLNHLTCLYIEDQVDSQILFKVQMKGLKDIKYAVSFEEALPLLDTEQFDFIVMDINLQGEYNGLDALKIIHKMQGYEDIPIIAVTAYVLPGDKEKFIATGFNDFIAKPIFREKMIESLEKIFLQKV